MKKLFTIGFGQFFASIIPILIWTLAGKLHGDMFANGMVYTYPYQFVFALIWHTTFIGSIKHELKDKLGTRNHSKTGIFVGTATGIILIVISIGYISIIAPFLGAVTDVDVWAFIFGLCSMGIDWPAYYLGEQYQYYGEEKRGTRFIIIWYIIKFILVGITALPVFDYISASVFVLSIQVVILIILLLRHARPENLQFSICQGIRYSIQDVFYNLFMTVIYLFGIHGMSVADVSLLAAFNLMVLCTDTQWDVCGSAIDVTVTGYVCDGTFDKQRKRIFICNLLFSILMVASSYVMMGILLFLYKDINPVYAFIYMTIELSTMILYGIIDTMSAYISVQYPSIWTGVLTIYKYVIRLLAQMLILSPYAISIALPVAVIADLPFRILLYRKARQKAVK